MEIINDSTINYLILQNENAQTSSEKKTGE